MNRLQERPARPAPSRGERSDSRTWSRPPGRCRSPRQGTQSRQLAAVGTAACPGRGWGPSGPGAESTTLIPGGGPDEARSVLGAAKRPGGASFPTNRGRRGACWPLSTVPASGRPCFTRSEPFPLVNTSRRCTALGPRRNPLPWHWTGQLLGGVLEPHCPVDRALGAASPRSPRAASPGSSLEPFPRRPGLRPLPALLDPRPSAGSFLEPCRHLTVTKYWTRTG